MKKRSNLTVMSRLIKLVKPLRKVMCAAVFMGLAGHLAASFITILAGLAAMDILGFKGSLNLTWIFIIMALLAAARGVLRYSEQSCNHYIAFKLLALIRDRVFLALRKLAPAKLEGKDKGNLISVITSDIELLEVFYAHTISPILIAVLFCAVMICFISRIHAVLGLCAAAAYFAVGVLIPLAISAKSKEDGLKFRTYSGDLSGFVLDCLRGLNETIQYGMGNKHLEKMNEKSDALFSIDERMKRTSGQCMALSSTVIWLFDLIMLALAVLLVQKGKIAFDGAIIAVLSLMSSFGPVNALAALGSTLQNTLASGNRVLDILDESLSVQEVSGQAPVKFDGAKVDHVSFAYKDETILEDCSLDIRSHEVIGIIGKSGSGKSTLLKLLMRFWDVNEGEITISNTPIKQINTCDLRDMESLVTQDTHLFHDSIANNIRIAKLNASDEEIMEACKKASVHDFIMSLPNGYDTMVAELGESLSGGERQRLSLARAFLHDAPFMLLDEPTSNLDSLNEAIILRSLDLQKQGKTIILVSHRPSTMKIADRVVAIQDINGKKMRES